jgi:hypothetical protein
MKTTTLKAGGSSWPLSRSRLAESARRFAGSFPFLKASLAAVGAVAALAFPTQGQAGSPTYQAAILADNPIAYWPLNDTNTTSLAAVDLTGNFNGTYGTNAVLAQPGPASPAYLGFPANNLSFQPGAVQSTDAAYVTVPALNLTTNTMTITMWINPEGDPVADPEDSWTGLFMCRPGSDASGLGLNGSGMLAYTWNQNNGDTYGFNSNLLIPYGTWSLAALTVVPGQATLYLFNTNGLQSAVNAIPQDLEPFNATSEIGADVGYAGTRTFFGSIADVAVFNYALSADQLVGLYGIATVAGALPPSIASSPTSEELYPGRPASLAVGALGTQLSYQWQLNGTNVAGATNTTLNIASVSATTAGNYLAIVSNPAGSATSSVASISIVNPTGAKYEAAVIAANPTAYWRFSETTGTSAYDYVGGFNAIDESGVTIDVPGPQSPALPGFEGTNVAVGINPANAPNSYVQVPPLNLSTNTVTLTAWIYPNGPQANWSGVFFGRGGATTAGINYSGNTDEIGYTWTGYGEGDQNTWGWNSGLTVPENQWSLVALVIDPVKATIYVGSSNSLVSAVNVYTNAIQTFASEPNQIGADPTDDTGRVFSGTIDEVAVFQSALTPSQIGALYAAGSGQSTVPTIGLQPVSGGLYAGETATLTATAAGTPPLAYQWQFGGSNLKGATNSTLVLPSLTTSEAGSYDLVVSNPQGSATSSVATLAVVAPATNAYAKAVLADNALAYWQLNETNGSLAYDYIGGFTATYQSNVVQGATGPEAPGIPGFAANTLAADFTNGVGSSYVAVPPLNLSSTSVTITAWIYPDGNQNAWSGIFFGRSPDTGAAGIGFSGGLNELGYTWNNNDGNTWGWSSGVFAPTNVWSFVALTVSPTNAAIYVFNTNSLQSSVHTYAHILQPFEAAPIQIGADPADDSGRVFIGTVGQVAVFQQSLSEAQLLALYGAGSGVSGFAPSIETEPSTVLIYNGSSTEFSVDANGTPPLSYQWQLDGTNIPGATSATLNVSDADAATSGSYTVTVKNPLGSATSTVAQLQLEQPTSAYESAIVAVHPLAYWRLGETNGTTAYDYAGGFNGTYASGAIQGVPGPESPAFPGFETNNLGVGFNPGNAPNSYVTVPALNISTNEPVGITFTAWLYPIADPTTGAESAWTGLFMCRPGSDASGIGYNGAGMLAYTWNENSGATYGFNSGLVLPYGQWVFVALTVTPTNAVLYMSSTNGLQSATNAIAHQVEQFNAAGQIGADPTDDTGRVFEGTIDEVAVFGYAMTGEQLSTLYGIATTAAPTVALPSENGTTVNGYQDDFTGATLNTNWVAVGGGASGHFIQTGGLLKAFASHGDPNHLIFAAPGYSTNVQQILARVRVVNFGNSDPYRAGISVLVNTNTTGTTLTNWEGINLHFRDNASEDTTSERHFKLLDDSRAWGPTNLGLSWTNNVWYWLRLQASPKADGTNTIFGKVWAADGVTQEPATWQLLWADSALKTPTREGFVAIAGSSNDGLAEFDVSYVLIQAAGLPSINVSINPNPPALQPPFFTSIAQAGNDVITTFFGPGTLQSTTNLLGTWTNVALTSPNPEFTNTVANAPQFYRLTLPPASMVGKSITLNITSGDGPFASAGALRFLTASSGTTYTNQVLQGLTLPSFGTYTYQPSGTHTAAVTISDSVAGPGTITLTFTSAATGTYTITIAAAAGAEQTGTFTIP